MASFDEAQIVFRAAPIIDYQMFLSSEKPATPSSYRLTDLGGVWLASDQKLRLTHLRDRRQRSVGLLVGFAYSEFHDEFLPDGVVDLPIEAANISDVELHVLPRLSGLFNLLTHGDLPTRLYVDHGGSFPIVYSAQDQRAASSSALLLDQFDYTKRFKRDLHASLIGREGAGGWISGSLTAHRDVYRLLPNHYLDLSDWTPHRFWPRAGDFDQWRDFDASVTTAATALTNFSAAANRAFKVAATMTAGFDSRLLLAGCRTSLPQCEFFTLEAPNAEMDIQVSRSIASRFGLTHRVLPLRQASEQEMATWDRMVGDCMVEAPRRTHVTLRDLSNRSAMFTGMYGEVGRCRLYRQDLAEINRTKIDARFVVDRLTLPPHPELLENISRWFAELDGQPNSVILDLAFHELKFGSWAMGQRPITNSIKLNFVPFAQRAVLEAFIGIEPAKKGTETLFWALIKRLWPELADLPINRYGDARDYLTVWKKLSNPNRVRRFLRDRLARKTATSASER